MRKRSAYQKNLQSFLAQKGDTHVALFVLLVAVFLEASVIGAALLGVYIPSGGKRADSNLERYARRVIETCKESPHRPSCYDKEIPKLMDGGLTMEDTFKVTRIIQLEDREYWYCHVLGHELSARETKKDPDNWKKVVARCPSGMCSNGCLHGSFQERFRTAALPDTPIEQLKNEISDICVARSDWHPTGMERATCYHALGHLTMYITNADIEKSTVLCEDITREHHDEGFRHLCYDGAFMQIFQLLDPEDFALVKGKQPLKSELASFCAPFSSEKKGSCWTEGWPLYFDEIKRPSGLVKFCDTLKSTASEYQRCFNALFYVLTSQFNFDQQKIAQYCAEMPTELRGMCFANAASRIIETDWSLIEQSNALCRVAATYDPNDAKTCYEELIKYSTYNFHNQSKEFRQLCGSLPSPWSTECFARAEAKPR